MAIPAKTDINPNTGKAYAVNPSSGNWDDNYWANTVEPALKRQYGVSATPTSTPSPVAGGVDVVAQAQKLYEQEQKWKQPAIAGLEAERGKVSGIFEPQRADIEAEKDPLKQRYESLLKDITKTTREAVGETFTARGLPMYGGMYEAAIGERTEPQVRQIGLEKEAGLRDLTRMQTDLKTQEGLMGQDIGKMIAQIQAATGQGAVEAAMSLFGMQQQERQSSADRAIQQQLADLRGRETGLAEQQFEYGKQQPDYSQYTALGEGQSIFNLESLQNIFKNPKTYKAGSTDGRVSNPGGI